MPENMGQGIKRVHTKRQGRTLIVKILIGDLDLKWQLCLYKQGLQNVIGSQVLKVDNTNIFLIQI